jgi:hypothetical protein
MFASMLGCRMVNDVDGAAAAIPKVYVVVDCVSSMISPVVTRLHCLLAGEEG